MQRRTPQPLTEEEEIRRVKLPRGKQTIGIVEQRLGGARMRVQCMDGKIRICRVPGRHKRRLWIREKDTVLLEPWEFGGDEKADIIFKYRISQVNHLKKRGIIKELQGYRGFLKQKVLYNPRVFHDNHAGQSSTVKPPVSSGVVAYQFSRSVAFFCTCWRL